MFRKKLGLALGSGSSRGLAHIGVIKAFEENKIPINYLSGSSVGTIISSFYASGMTGAEIEEVSLNFIQNPPFSFSINPLSAFIIFIKSLLRRFCSIGWLKTSKGLIDWENIYHFLEDIIGKLRFDQLKIPLIVTSTDLVSGEGIAFVPSNFPGRIRSLRDMNFYYNEFVVDAVVASVLIPGIFVPFPYHDRNLVDGGIKNGVPVDLLHLWRPDVIVGVDLGFNSQSDDMIEDPLSAAIQVIDIMGQEISSLNLQKYADIVIKPKVKGINLKDMTTVKNAIKTGKEAGERALPAIKAKLGIL